MVSFKQFIVEGGNVFAGKTASIALENITPTLKAYFAELSSIFPKKKAIFNSEHFKPLGSVGKKPFSGDIDLAVDSKSILDHEMSDRSISDWGIDIAELNTEVLALAKRARTSTPAQLRMKAFLKLLALYINKNAKDLYVNEKKITDGNIFGLYPQVDPKGKHIGIGVQIDWMVGNLEWLTFSYHSAAYPKGSNVKGLHRTQLMLSAFQVANMSFDHVSGVKDKATGKVIATDPANALKVLGDKLGFVITQSNAEDYYKLHKLLKNKMKPADYESLLRIYLKILDSTRTDIPDDMQPDWIRLQKELDLKGKFLPDDSALIPLTIAESGSTGADRVTSRADFKQFLASYEKLIRDFPGYVAMKPSGSYNSDLAKHSFGDIDLVVHIKSDKTKVEVKKDLAVWLTAQPDTVIVPFGSAKYKGKRHLSTGELVTVRYHDDTLGYSAQVDNIISLSPEETHFKGSFLDLPAERQGLVIGLAKVAAIETAPSILFKKLGIKAQPELPENEEYEFNLSSVELSLRHNVYKPGTFETVKTTPIWTTKKFTDVEKLLYQYELDVSFDDLLKQIKRTLKNPRSAKRVAGVFSSMISVKSGEVDTPKGDNKLAAQAKVRSVLG